MVSELDYDYCAKLLLYGSIFFLLLFIIYDRLYQNKNKYILTQTLITLSISLFILSFVTNYAIKEKELNTDLIYYGFTIGIPFVIGLLFLLFVYISYNNISRNPNTGFINQLKLYYN